MKNLGFGAAFVTALILNPSTVEVGRGVLAQPQQSPFVIPPAQPPPSIPAPPAIAPAPPFNPPVTPFVPTQPAIAPPGVPIDPAFNRARPSGSSPFTTVLPLATTTSGLTPDQQGLIPAAAPAAPATPLFLNLSGTVINDPLGQPVGSVQQIVLTPSGTITFAVVSVGGRLLPVPWPLIGTSSAPGRAGLVLNGDRSLLQTAPPVLMSQLPLLTQDAVQRQIYGFYGLGPAAADQAGTDATTAQGRPGNASVTVNGGSTLNDNANPTTQTNSAQR